MTDTPDVAAPRLTARQLHNQLLDQMRTMRSSLQKAMGPVAYGDASRAAQVIINKVMRENRMDILEAVSKLSARADERGDTNAAQLVCAAAIDMLDPEDAPARTTVLHS